MASIDFEVVGECEGREVPTASAIPMESSELQLSNTEGLEVSVDVLPLQVMEESELVLGVDDDVEVFDCPQELILDEINYSTPDGKSHRVSQYSGAIDPPSVGMTFDSWEMVESYFRTYAKHNGFGIVRGSSAYRQKNGKPTNERRSVRWECEYYGTKDNRVRVNGKKVSISRMHCVAKAGLKLATRGTKKCQCPVHVYASCQRNADNVWVIRKSVLEHEGHKPTPSKSRHVAMFRKDAINARVRRKLLIDLEAGVKLPQIHRAMALERNGLQNMPFTERDLRNEVAKQKKMKMDVEGGDAQAMVNYLKTMAAENDKFYHAERVDAHDRLKDVMWVDARSRAAYADFGDVVCFDTTYITNKFKLPFANFVGVNHHGQTILFGCALLSHENAETFEWLFENWLCCMGGKAPAGILTDQCAAMRKALVKVMPHSRHRWCLWHILQKFSSKLGAYKDYETFKDELHNAIYDSLSVEEFNVNWISVIGKYNLQQQEWLAGLFKEQHMWVPAHMKDIFWAGMKTTQRSESINSFFDGYVKKQTMLYEFISQYFAALEARAYAEENADADSSRIQQPLVTQFPIEVEFHKKYTRAKLVEFQKECLKLMYVNQTSSWKVNDHVIGHRTDDQIWHRCKSTRKEYPTEKYCHYIVMLDMRTFNAWCSCKLFESHGIVCRHIVRVYAGHRVKKVPEMFILERWRKDIVRPYTKVKVRHHDLSKTEEVKRYDEIMIELEGLCLMGARTEEYKDLVISAMRKTLEELEARAERDSMSKEGENVIVELENGLSPSSVNKRRLSDGENLSSPSSVACKEMTTGSVSGASGSGSGSLPAFIKDPPLPKNPKHRTTSSRFKSATELNRSKKGKSGGRRTEANDSNSEVPLMDIQHTNSYQSSSAIGPSINLDGPGQPSHLNADVNQVPQDPFVQQATLTPTYDNAPPHQGLSSFLPSHSNGERSVFPRSIGSIMLSGNEGGGTTAMPVVTYGTVDIPPEPNLVPPHWMRGVISRGDMKL